MTLNWIWWWGFSSGALGNVKYSFIVITPRPTLTLFGSTCNVKGSNINRISNINEGNTSQVGVTSGAIMKHHHISESTRWTQLFRIWKFIFWQQYFTLQSSPKRKRKIDWKIYWCSLESERRNIKTTSIFSSLPGPSSSRQMGLSS